ncbi:MAG: NAD-dependent epimerase/dehydratase family protein [Proteobacteria bacterium]|nr:NAD-dependent epimerase/dehydratase family protein [Pseudomonadota bacterium]
MAMFKKALVTGGAGFIGAHLVALLVKEGVKVTVLDTAVKTKGLPKEVKGFKGSILDQHVLEKAMKGQECVFHLAALTHLWARHKKDFAAVNVEGTRNVLAAAKKAKVKKIVVTSTETILRGWRDPDPFPISENDPAPALDDMAGPYTRSKWRADQLVREAAKSGLPVVSVYPAVPVGPGDYNLTAPTRMILDFVKGKTPAYLNALLNYVPVGDVARGHYQAAILGAPGGRYILGGENLAMAHFLERLEDVSGQKMPKRRVPFELAYSFAVLSEFLADVITRKPPLASKEGVRLALNPSFVTSQLAADKLGYRPSGVKPALKATVEWFREEGLI